MRTRNRTKKGRCSHQEQRPSPGDFVRKFSHSRASAEKLVLSQATVVISYPVGRPPLSRQPFLMLTESKTSLAEMASFLRFLPSSARLLNCAPRARAA